MARAEKVTELTFREHWDKSLKWFIDIGLWTIPGTIVTLIFALSVVNMYTGWFYTY